MTVLEGINRKSNSAFASGVLVARQQLVAHDLQAVSRFLLVAPYNLVGAAERSKQTYKFPALAAGAPLLVDEGLRLPVSLATALQTAAMYQGMNWEQPINRRYLSTEFFRKYVELLVKESVKLAVTRQLGLDLALANLVVVVAQGEPSSVQVRRFGGVVGPTFPQPGTGSNFEFTALTPAFYYHFMTGLLNENLRPLVTKLVEVSGAKPEVFWDYAIETMLGALAELDIDGPTLAQAQAFLLTAELDPGDRIAPSAPVSACSPAFGNSFGNGNLIYLKRRCCEKFKKKTRCDNCPGRKRN